MKGIKRHTFPVVTLVMGCNVRHGDYAGHVLEVWRVWLQNTAIKQVVFLLLAEGLAYNLQKKKKKGAPVSHNKAKCNNMRQALPFTLLHLTGVTF